MLEIDPKIFKEYDIRGRYPTEINEAIAYGLGAAFVLYLKAKKIVVGRDSRLASAKLMPHFVKGVTGSGCQVYDLGKVGTTTVSFANGFKDFDGAVAITASHNPMGYAGFKMLNRLGVPIGEKSGLKKIARLAGRVDKKNKTNKSRITQLKINNEYYRFLLKNIGLKSLAGVKAVLDMSNGSGGDLVSDVFDHLLVKYIKVNFLPGDRYPDHGPNPLLLENQRVISDQVKKQKADVGLVWDADADRIIFFDEKGDLVHPYYLNCLLSQIILAEKSNQSLVIDARMIMGISSVIKNSGGRPVISRAGTANIIKLMQQKKIIFGCENSGHYYFNFLYNNRSAKNYVYSDAIMPALLVMAYLKKNNLKMSEAVAGFRKEIFISDEINFKVSDFSGLAKKLKKKYHGCRFSYIDGLSVSGDGWFFNVRPSHTEPLVRLNIEAKSLLMLNRLEKELIAVIKNS